MGEQTGQTAGRAYLEWRPSAGGDALNMGDGAHGDVGLAVFEALPSGLLVVDAGGVVTMANAEVERIFGYMRAELLGQPLRNFAALSPSNAVDNDAERPPHPTTREMWGHRYDGGSVLVEVTSLALGPDATLIVVNDITRRGLAEAALKAKSEELERSNADLEQFAYVASHDLQEPLRMVSSFTQLLAEKYQGRLDENADRYIGYAVDGARRMQDLVRDLLSYSRVTASPRPLELVDVNVLVADVLVVMEATIAAAQGVICVGDLPNVIADGAQLRHVFLNGLGNALKFRGKDSPRVSIHGEMSGGMAIFSIEDNGIGLDPRHAARIFQMFQRLHGRGAYEGSGIGLAIVKKIVERHSGRVWMEGEPGNGARLYFALPGAPQ